MNSDAKEKIHFVGVGGTGMGTFAAALARSGHRVSGSDGALYEPMKTVLKNSSIDLIEGYHAETVQKVQADRVIIGNVTRRDNPEAMAWIRSGINFLSFPEAVRRYLIEDKKSIVVAGTHGKTTTTTWIAFLLSELGLNPSYLIGGVPKDLSSGCELNSGDWFVGEGDEYDSAFFDKGPKFLHYHPHFAVINNIEFDHADIYKDLAHVRASFEKLIALLPGDGLLIARYDDPQVLEVLSLALCPVETFGVGEGAMWRLGKVEESPAGYKFEVLYKRKSVGEFETIMLGQHNLINIVAGIACAMNMGISLEKVRPIVKRFGGVKRRQEILVRGQSVLVDDFAHHPTEVTATVKAVRQRFPKGKLWTFFEPRSATARRNIHQHEYPKAFAMADEVRLKSPFKATDLKAEERFSSDELAAALRITGKSAQTFDTVDEIVENYRANAQVDDVLLVMSNGEFDKIQDKLRAVLSTKS